MLRKLKRRALDALYRSRFYPNIFFFPNPFKTLELRALLQGLPLRKDAYALDLGSGLGIQTNILGRHVGRILGIDPQKDAVDRANSERYLVEGRIDSEFRCTTIEDAGLADDSFDFVFSICVLEHIPDDLSALKECHRVMKPGGWLAFSIDSLATIEDAAAKAYHKERYLVQRYYTPEAARNLFAEAGFRDIQIYSAVVSKYAARLFTKDVTHDFGYRYLQGLWLSFRLWLADCFTRDKSQGIYLVVHARK